MAWFDIIWNYDDEDGNVEHVAQHDLTPEDINEVLENPIREEISESSGRPIAFGYPPRRLKSKRGIAAFVLKLRRNFPAFRLRAEKSWRRPPKPDVTSIPSSTPRKSTSSTPLISLRPATRSPIAEPWCAWHSQNFWASRSLSHITAGNPDAHAMPIRHRKNLSKNNSVFS